MNHNSPEQCLAVVEQSPAAVAQHDKAAWMALFADNNTVEDPVGSAPHVTVAGELPSNDHLSRFYETFIAPNRIRFHVDQDIVSGLHVMRDLTIEIAMSSKVTVRVPVHLLYELTQQGEELKISRLAAHWELRPMLLQQLSAGSGFIGVGLASGIRMLRHLGLRGTAGFMRALSGAGEEGKQQVRELIRCCNHKDAAAVEQLLLHQNIEVSLPTADGNFPIGQLAAQEGTLRVSKILSAGETVSATVFYTRGKQVNRGVALFQLQPHSFHISAATFYW